MSLSQNIVAVLLEDEAVDPKEFVQRDNDFGTIQSRPDRDGFYIYFPPSADGPSFFDGGWDTLQEAIDFYHNGVSTFDALIVQVTNGKARRVMGFDEMTK